jgi:hypothetical protein
MGCGETLEVVSAGRIMCQEPTCPRPYAVRDLLKDNRVGHVAEFAADGFTLHHPMHERVSDQFQNCSVIRELRSHTTPPVGPGRYQVVEQHGGFMYVDLGMIEN